MGVIRSNKSQVVMDKALTVLSNFKLSSGCELEAMKWIDAMWVTGGGALSTCSDRGWVFRRGARGVFVPHVFSLDVLYVICIFPARVWQDVLLPPSFLGNEDDFKGLFSKPWPSRRSWRWRERKMAPLEGHENQATATKRKSVILLGFRCTCLSVYNWKVYDIMISLLNII